MQTFAAYMEKRLVEDNLYQEGWFGDFMDTITGGRWGAYQDYRADAKQTRLANLSKKAALKSGNAVSKSLENAQTNLETKTRDAIASIKIALAQLEKTQQDSIQMLQNTKMKTPDGANIFTPEQLQFLNQIQEILNKNKKDVDLNLEKTMATLGNTVQASKYGTSEIMNLANHAASVIGSTKRFNPDTATTYNAPDVAQWRQANMPAHMQWRKLGNTPQARQKAAATRRAKNTRNQPAADSSGAA